MKTGGIECNGGNRHKDTDKKHLVIKGILVARMHIPAETGDVEVRRSTGVNRRDHHRAGIISSKHSDSNRLRPCVGMALPLIELPFCDVRGVEDTNSAVSVEVTAVRW